MAQQNEHFGNSEQLNKSVDHIGDVNKMVTAVEWYVKEIQNRLKNIGEVNYIELAKEAKEMEKKQIINADLNATIRTAKGFNADVSVRRVKELAEQYYNETYNK